MFIHGQNYVFGAAEKGGRICAVSLYRLDQRFYGRPASYERFKERAVKEAIHELGHCYGLDHCKNKKCVMVFSNDIISVDTKGKFFCEGCREKLRKAL
jgi:archaemetzincin